MTYTFIATTKFFLITAGEADNSIEDFSFATGKEAFFQLFPDPKYIQKIGTLRLESIKKYPFLYKMTTNENQLFRPIELSKMNADHFDPLHHIFSGLWFVKDNSSFIVDRFVFHENPDYASFGRGVSYTNSEGLSIDTLFSLQEINEAKVFADKINQLSDFNKKFSEQNIPAEAYYTFQVMHSIDYNWTNRIDRAFLFLGQARGAALLTMKISFYIPIFECLFSTGNTEISHQVAERAAFYLGGTKDQVAGNYKNIKAAYNIRSRYLHGEKLTGGHKEINKQKVLSSQLDSITRQILRKILLNDSDLFLNERDLNDWLSSLIFSGLD